WPLSSKARLPPARPTGPWRAGVILGSPPSVKLSQTARWRRGIIPPCMNDPQPEGHMASYIGRRNFLATLGGAAVAWPLTAHAQQQARVSTVGFLVAGTPSTHGQWLAAFVRRLGELGWVEGRNIAIEVRWAEGHGGRLAEIATELVRLKVDVVGSHPAT